MHPIITAAIADERHAELQRQARRDRKVQAVKRESARTERVPVPRLLLRGWLARG